MKVTVTRDVWDWLSLWATVIAALLALIAIGIALWAIRRTNKLASDADAALVRERRETFELGVLARLAQALGYYTAGSGNAVRNLLGLIPREELSALRVAVGNAETLPNGDMLSTYHEEYEQAVSRRMHPASLRPSPVHLRMRLAAAFRGFIRGVRTGA
jgi:hypothetical protein